MSPLSGIADADLAAKIHAALQAVIDPELGRDVVALGLIYHVEATDAGDVRIVMTTTIPGCPAAGFLVDAVRYAASAVEGIGGVDVRLTHEPPWHPGMMTS